MVITYDRMGLNVRFGRFLSLLSMSVGIVESSNLKPPEETKWELMNLCKQYNGYIPVLLLELTSSRIAEMYLSKFYPYISPVNFKRIQQ
jgi:hypothetical protein